MRGSETDFAEELGADQSSDNGASIRVFVGKRNLLGAP